jgi:hypothetical protein
MENYMSTFNFLSRSEQADCEQHLQTVAPLAELFGTALKLSLPAGPFSPQRVTDVAGLCYYGKQLGSISVDAFIDPIKDCRAIRMAAERVRDLRAIAMLFRKSGLALTRKKSAAAMPPGLLPDGLVALAEDYLEAELDIPLLERFLETKSLKDRLEAWSHYMGFADYASVRTFYDRLNAFCAQHNFGNYRKLCQSTAYFDHLMRMDPSIRDLFAPEELAFHRNVFGTAAPFWIDALIHCRRGRTAYWIEAFAAGAAKAVLLMERRGADIVVHSPRGLSFYAESGHAPLERDWHVRPEEISRITEIARKRLGKGLIHYVSELVLAGGAQ